MGSSLSPFDRLTSLPAPEWHSEQHPQLCSDCAAIPYDLLFRRGPPEFRGAVFENRDDRKACELMAFGYLCFGPAGDMRAATGVRSAASSPMLLTDTSDPTRTFASRSAESYVPTCCQLDKAFHGAGPDGCACLQGAPSLNSRTFLHGLMRQEFSSCSIARVLCQLFTILCRI